MGDCNENFNGNEKLTNQKDEPKNDDTTKNEMSENKSINHTEIDVDKENEESLNCNIGVAKKRKISKDNKSVPTLVWNKDNVLMNMYNEIDSLKRKLDQQVEMYSNLEINYRSTLQKNNELESKVVELSSKSNNDNQSKKSQSRYWTKEEHEKFLDALKIYGKKDVKNISLHVGTRNPTQVRTHAQKYFLKQKKENEKKSQQKDTDIQKEDQYQKDWTKVNNTRKTPSPIFQNTGSPYGVEVRKYYSPPPQEEMRSQQFYSNSPYDNFYPSMHSMEMKREGYMVPPWNENLYPKKHNQYTNHSQGEFVYNTQVNSGSLQTMAESITQFDRSGKYNYKHISNSSLFEEEDDELSRLNEKNKKTHVLSDLIGGPVSISPQIYASPSPLIGLSPNYPYKNSL